MTKAEAGLVVKWIVGMFPSWLNRATPGDIEPTMELMVRQLEPLEYERTFERVRRLCYGQERSPEARAFAPAMAEILAALDIVACEAIAAYDQAVLHGGQLIRAPYDRAAIDGWLYVPPGVAAPPPIRLLPEPEPPRESVPATQLPVDPRLAILRQRHRAGRNWRRVAEVLPEPPTRPEVSKGVVE